MLPGAPAPGSPFLFSKDFHTVSFILPRVVVAALRGGSGKTTLTLGLIQALKDRGLPVAPFKKGPDYIDPFWHSEAAGAPCRNLDPYLMGREQVLRSFGWHGQGFACAVVEGNRGLYDGMDAQGSYSTAELAKWLAAPVILVLDCSMTSRTVAAVALGCQQFDPELNLAGVILNPVANARQEAVVRRALADHTGLPVLGAVPRLELNLPQRHMGLVPPQEHQEVARALHQAGRSVAGYVDLDAVWAIMQQTPPLAPPTPPEGLFPANEPSGPPAVIGVVKDAAFGFYYPENLEALVHHGARLVEISALEDPALPPGLGALYIGGGFPETHAARLAANRSFRASLLAAAQDGLPIYAECGGLMYLGQSLTYQGETHEMVGLFPLDFLMRDRPQGHGYSECQVERANPFLPPGHQFRAHEFHYSEPCVRPGTELVFAYRVLRGKGLMAHQGGLLCQRVLGTYHHVHALGLAPWAQGLVAAARGN
ncbi:MAG: cobyrinate a,c-diamide synthase [Deltaproteobacteria bacterium]|nr:cobyrinate a,c-diamide synthase [Deltaproteobacteria bacterium]